MYTTSFHKFYLPAKNPVLRGNRLLLQQVVDEDGVYLLNVAVGPGWRGQGCGKFMLEAAEKIIRKRWNAASIYTHVSKGNDVSFPASVVLL